MSADGIATRKKVGRSERVGIARQRRQLPRLVKEEAESIDGERWGGIGVVDFAADDLVAHRGVEDPFDVGAWNAVQKKLSPGYIGKGTARCDATQKVAQPCSHWVLDHGLDLGPAGQGDDLLGVFLVLGIKQLIQANLCGEAGMTVVTAV